MNHAFKIAIIIIIFGSCNSFAQETKVDTYLKMLAQGKIEEVKMQLPDLLAEFPDDPGVLLLHASVIEDGWRALEIYKEIVKNYPESQWADDANWRVVQFYAIVGDTTKAKTELEMFRKKYPTSQYLGPSAEVVRTSITYARRESKSIPVKKSESVSEKHTAATEKHTSDVAYLSGNDEPKSVPEKKAKPEVKTETKHAEGTEKKVTAIEKKTEPVKPNTERQKEEDDEVDEKGSFGLQVGIFSSRDAAIQEMRRFLNQRMRTEVKEKTVDGEKMWAVVIGDYSSKESAEAAKIIVQQQCKCSPMIFKK
jgi:cell division septation protein DedD